MGSSQLMNRYYLELFGLRVTLLTPFPLKISQRIQPFLCQPHPETVDCTICISICDTLPQPEGIWHGPDCYLRNGNELIAFHCHESHSMPFAVTRMDGSGNVQITVLPDYAGYFSGSSGIFNRIGMENMLLQHSGLLLHASLIEYADRCIAFTGPSGVGKSTQAQLWQTCLGANILNGDRAAVRNTGTGWMAYGSPYAGTSGIYKNEQAPLAGIVILRHGKENSLRPVSFAEAFPCIWPEISLRRWDEGFVTRAMELCEKLLADVPLYYFECLPEESAAHALKKGLSL